MKPRPATPLVTRSLVREVMEVEGRVEEEEGPGTTTAMKSELSVYL